MTRPAGLDALSETDYDFVLITCPPNFNVVADLAACERIEAPHIAEAIQYQPRAASWEG